MYRGRCCAFIKHKSPQRQRACYLAQTRQGNNPSKLLSAGNTDSDPGPCPDAAAPARAVGQRGTCSSAWRRPALRSAAPAPQDVTTEPADTAALNRFVAVLPCQPARTARRWRNRCQLVLPRAVPRRGRHRALRTRPPPQPLLRVAPGTRSRSPRPAGSAGHRLHQPRGAHFPLCGAKKTISPFFLSPLGNGTAPPSRLGTGAARDAAAARGAGQPGPHPARGRRAASSPGASRKEEGGENGFHFRLLAGTTSPQNILGQ